MRFHERKQQCSRRVEVLSLLPIKRCPFEIVEYAWIASVYFRDEHFHVRWERMHPMN